MTYVDGYNSFSGEVNIPIIPENMLSLMANGFYQRINTKGFQIDFRKNKKEIVISYLVIVPNNFMLQNFA